MFDLSLKNEDEEWLSQNYPALRIERLDENVVQITGTLRFSMAFRGEGQPYVLNPPRDYSEGITIDDEYEIRIEFRGSEFSDLPQVSETGGRLQKVAESRHLKLIDLHINPSRTACLCIRLEEITHLPNGFSLEEFFNKLLIPFFYGQSYFEKNSHWPWGQYSHGVWGYIEWYLQHQDPHSVIEDLLDLLGRKYGTDWGSIKKALYQKHPIKGHQTPCICGAQRKIRDCHPGVLRGLWKLRGDISALGISA